MNEPTHKELFLQSLDRCTVSEKFVPSFYDRFLASSDEVRHKFRHTDFERQNRMLQGSLRLAAGATAGEPEALQELGKRAKTHDRQHLNIEPELYELWRTAIITTAREFDDHWDDKTENAWQTILGHVINYMVKHY